MMGVWVGKPRPDQTKRRKLGYKPIAGELRGFLIVPAATTAHDSANKVEVHFFSEITPRVLIRWVPCNGARGRLSTRTQMTRAFRDLTYVEANDAALWPDHCAPEGSACPKEGRWRLIDSGPPAICVNLARET